MIVTPEDYVGVLKREEAVRERSREREAATLNRARECPVPANLRPATREDVVRHAVIWFSNLDSGWVWRVVEEPLLSYSGYRGFLATDGCDYEVDEGAFVEVR